MAEHFEIRPDDSALALKLASKALRVANGLSTARPGSLYIPNDDGTGTLIGPAAGTDPTGGSNGVAPWVGDTTPPGKPTGVSVTSSWGIVNCIWDGTLEGGIPADFAYVGISIDDALAGNLTEAGSVTVDGFSDEQQITVKFVAYDSARDRQGNLTPNASEQAIVSHTVDNAKERIDADVEQAKQDAADAKDEVQTASEKADAAAEKADSYQQQITDVTTTVNGVVQEVEGYSAQIAGAVEDAGAALSAVTSLEADVDGFKTSVSQTYQTKQDAAWQMAQEVLDRNSAIEQSASEITQSVSETYQVKGDYLTEGQAAEVYASKAELSTTADAITATVEEKFDDSLLVKEADGGIVDCGDTAGMPLAGLTVYGQTRQNLWVNPSGTQNGLTVTSNEDGTVTIAGDQTSGVIINSPKMYIFKPGVQYTVSIDKKPCQRPASNAGAFAIKILSADGSQLQYIFVGGRDSEDNVDQTFVVSSYAAYAVFRLVTSDGFDDYGTYRVMLNEGSEAQPWCPPGLDSLEDVTVWQAGKNLWFNPPEETNNGITFVPNDDGSFTVSGSLTQGPGSGTLISRGVNMVPPPGSEVTLSVDSQISDNYARVVLIFKDSAGNAVGGNHYVGHGGVLSKTIIVPESAERMTCGFYIISSSPAGTEVSGTFYPQLEFGTTATDYEPPSVASTPIDLLGNKVSSLPDGTRDELVVDAGGNVVLRKNVGEYTYDGEEFWSLSSTGTTVFIRTENTADLSEDNNIYCDRLAIRERNEGTGDYRNILAGLNASQTANTVWLDYPGFSNSNISEFKEELKARPVRMLAKLSEQTTIPLGTVNLPDLPEQNAHVWISTGTQGLDPDIHATWYGENASALKDFASKAELKVESDQIKAMVEETYTTKDEVSTTYATKSEVTQTANSIKSEVSEEYVSKDDASATYATKTSVSTVEQTVDSLTSTVSSNYTTLNNKFGNYYTKTQVDQKDSSIKSTVSEVQTTANSALTKATTVEQTADGLEVRLTQAEKDVDTAQTTANAAKKQLYHSAGGTSGTAGYVKFAQIKISSAYMNRPIYFSLSNRGQAQSNVWIQFGNSSSTDPPLSSIKADGGINVYIYKSATSTWDVVAQKSESYDTVFVNDYSNNNSGVTVSWTNVQLSSVSGYTAATRLAAKRESSDIDDAAKTATNYLEFDSAGLCVGDMTSGTLGYNTLIASEGFYIRKGSYVLASFEPGNIYLGGIKVEDSNVPSGILSASESTIDFAGGKITARTETTTGGRYQNRFNIIENSGLAQINMSTDYMNINGNAVNIDASVGDITLNPMTGDLCKKSSNYEIFGGRRLYYNSSGATEHITLSESAANFDFLDIFFLNFDGYRDCVRVYSPNGKTAVLSNAVYKQEYTTTYIRNKVVSISGTSVTVVSNRNGETYVGQNNTCSTVESASVIKIYAVWGWK